MIMGEQHWIEQEFREAACEFYGFGLYEVLKVGRTVTVIFVIKAIADERDRINIVS
jgi:hypothetical protein